jgi:hypothetical protein
MKDVFAKKFLVPGEIPLAARSQFFGNTLILRQWHNHRASSAMTVLLLKGASCQPAFGQSGTRMITTCLTPSLAR